MTLACVDVDYRGAGAVAACLLFSAWSDPGESARYLERLASVAPYVPGRFFERELPAVLAVLARAPPVDVLVVDGHAWLAPGVPGLGAHVHDALHGRCVVVGVAKTPYRGSPHAARVLRGASTVPLYVTAAGVEDARAAEWIAKMHGAFRVPTLLKRVDRACRSA